jgi:hypothetical protein
MGPTTLSAAWAGAATAATPSRATPSADHLVNFERLGGDWENTIGLLSMDRNRSCRGWGPDDSAGLAALRREAAVSARAAT